MSGSCAPGQDDCAEALGITDAQNGLALDAPPFELRARSGELAIVIGPRIGITKAADHPVAVRAQRLARFSASRFGEDGLVARIEPIVSRTARNDGEIRG